MMKNARETRSGRRALSLLEVILAMAILGGALAAIGELVRSGARNAELARDLTTAQLLGETMMSEIAARMIPLQAINESPVDDPQYQLNWSYSVAIEQVDQEGLVSVWVTIQQNAENHARPATYTLVRWMIDPEMSLSTETL
jgi:Tfp pilus assembly protein PilV